MAKIKTVQVKKTRYGTYSLHYINPDGRRRRLSVGENYQIAQRLAVNYTDWLLDGKDPEHEMVDRQLKEKYQRITMRELYPTFMRHFGGFQSANMQSSYHYMFKSLCRCPQVVDIPIGSVQKRKVMDYIQARMENDNAGPATVNKEASFIKRMLSFAVEYEILDKNPLEGFKKLRESEKRRVEITPEQAGILINALPRPIANIVEFAIYIGFRKENILSLQIQQITVLKDRPTAIVELTIKGGRSEIFPLGDRATAVLKRVIGRRKKGYVFVNPRTGTRYVSIHKRFDRVVRLLGLTVNGTKLRFHDLRHVFCTWILENGVSIDAIRELAGHRQRSTTDRYATLNRLKVGAYLSAIPEIERPGLKLARKVS